MTLMASIGLGILIGTVGGFLGGLVGHVWEERSRKAKSRKR